MHSKDKLHEAGHSQTYMLGTRMVYTRCLEMRHQCLAYQGQILGLQVQLDYQVDRDLVVKGRHTGGCREMACTVDHHSRAILKISHRILIPDMRANHLQFIERIQTNLPSRSHRHIPCAM